MASTTSSRPTFKGLKTTTGMPAVCVFSAAATVSVALENTLANWFSEITWSFQANSYDRGVAVPAAMSWKCVPMASVQALLSRSSGYLRPPSHSAAIEAFSAASASVSWRRSHRFR